MGFLFFFFVREAYFFNNLVYTQTPAETSPPLLLYLLRAGRGITFTSKPRYIHHARVVVVLSLSPEYQTLIPQLPSTLFLHPLLSKNIYVYIHASTRATHRIENDDHGRIYLSFAAEWNSKIGLARSMKKQGKRA